MAKIKKRNSKTQKKENKTKPIFLVKATKIGGIDYLHISLIALVIILIALAFAFAKLKPINTCYNLNNSVNYGISNNSCVKLEHNNTQVLNAVEKLLAGYATVNSTFSLLPYYSYVNDSKIYYLENANKYFVEIPFKDPFISNKTLNFSMLLNGSNLALINTFTQSLIQPKNTNNKVVHFGVVKLAGKVACATSNTIPIYLFNDPYSVSALSSLFNAINISKKNPNINMSYYFIFGLSSIKFYNSYGTYKTQLFGQYLACSSQQPEFYAFLSNISKLFSGSPLSNYTLYQTAYGSGLNTSQLNTCITNSTNLLTKESNLAKFYNIVSVPEFVINCEYTSLPQTLINAVNYSKQQK